MQNKREGFSMMETILGLFGLIFISLISNAYIMAFMKTNVSIKEVSQATAVGNTVMEQLRMKAYSVLNGGADTVDSKYCCSWTVNPQPGARSVINLKVQWPLGVTSGKNCHTIQMSTIRAQ
jgi:hypothetical protein